MTTHPPGIRIVLISGSVRLGNFTGKSLALVADEIRKHSEIAAEQIDPAKMTLPLPGTDRNSSDSARLRESVSSATGVILATPEYHGSFSSVIKLVIENLGFPSALAGKPVALLGVAAGQIGAIKALEGLSQCLLPRGRHRAAGRRFRLPMCNRCLRCGGTLSWTRAWRNAFASVALNSDRLYSWRRFVRVLRWRLWLEAVQNSSADRVARFHSSFFESLHRLLSSRLTARLDPDDHPVRSD